MSRQAPARPTAPTQDGARDVLALPLARLRLRFVRRRAGRLPPYTGSLWRGAFGRALRRLCCVTSLDRCDPCALRHACPYACAFETPPPPGATRMRRYDAVPHPFVIEPPEDAHAWPPGPRPAPAALTLGLTVIGGAHRWLGTLVAAMAEAAGAGLGRDRVRYDLVAVWQERIPGTGAWQPVGAPGALDPLPPAPPAPLEPPRRLQLRLLTPLRLVRDEALVGAARFRFGDLHRNLQRRIASLHHFHGAGPLAADFRGLAQAADAVPLAARRLRWLDWRRWSSRQRAMMAMGGLVGELELDGAHLGPFWPWLQLGALVHAGKATSMGLGRYELEAA